MKPTLKVSIGDKVRCISRGNKWNCCYGTILDVVPWDHYTSTKDGMIAPEMIARDEKDFELVGPATNKLEVKVDVTAAMQDTMNQFAKEFYKDYGVTLEEVSFDWLPTIDRMVLLGCTVTTGKRN